MINLQQQLRLGLKLTPQQIQYLKLLQLPTLALEQRIKLELEMNPMLELSEEQEPTLEQEAPETDSQEDEEVQAKQEEDKVKQEEDSYTLDDYMNDDLAGFKSPETTKNSNDDDESYESPLPSTIPLTERLLSQFRFLSIDDEDILLAEEILGNVDEDGYLRRELELIVQDLNLSFGLNISVEKATAVQQKILHSIRPVSPHAIFKSVWSCSLKPAHSRRRSKNSPSKFSPHILKISN